MTEPVGPADGGRTDGGTESFLRGAIESARRVFGDETSSEELPPVSVELGTGAGENGEGAELLTRLAGRSGARLRYRLDGEIDRGGQGTVQRVWDEDLQRPLAMKTVRETRAPGVTRFLVEALVTGQLDHPGIVPVHELGLDAEGRVFFTMKLVRGEDLRTVLARVRAGSEDWTEARALAVMLKVCEAMAYAHAKGVIHRDLKPGNVMVGRFGEVHVMDWGLARVVGRADARDLRIDAAESAGEHVSVRVAGEADSPLLTRDGHVLGTPAYMSSEQALGRVDEIGPHTDVYAVGSMLYELLAGHPPYLEPGQEPGCHALWWRVRQGSPASLAERAPHASPELVAITDKAMARDWRRRYPDMGALADDLRAWLEGRVVRAYESGRFAELRKWVARNRLFTGSVAISLFLLVAGTSTTSVVLAGKNRALERAQIDGDELLLLGLESQAAELGPAEPANVKAYEEWLGRAYELARRVDEAHRARLAQFAEATLAGAPGTEETRERLTRFVARADALAGPEGARTRVESLLQLARTLRARSLDGTDVRVRWEAARAAIRDESPAYENLDLEPQLGLVPLGEDAESGLWEFWHVATGNEPRRDERAGRVALAEGDGIVLVLIPGGPTRMGAQPTDVHGWRHDAYARSPMEVRQDVVLAPFFMSKYELTQDQWERMSGSNPSVYHPPSRFGEHRITATNPVESIDWEEAHAVLTRYGLTMPTEAQWEHAARAWSDTVWWTGDEPGTLEGMENLGDRSLAKDGVPSEQLESWDDGYRTHAPVGSFAPNPFGLYDMGGNVKEWGLDWLGQYARKGFTEETGERIVSGGADRVVRGGSFMDGSEGARSALRSGARPRVIQETIGVRPARGIVRSPKGV